MLWTKYFGYLRTVVVGGACVNNLWIFAHLLFCIIYAFIIIRAQGGVQARQRKTDKDFVLILIKSTVAHRLNLKSFTEPNPSPGNLWLFNCPKQQSEESWRAIRDLCQWNVVQWGRYSSFGIVIKWKGTVDISAVGASTGILKGESRKSGTGRNIHIMSSRKTQCLE